MIRTFVVTVAQDILVVTKPSVDNDDKVGMIKTESCIDANFVTSRNTRGRRYDNLRYQPVKTQLTSEQLRFQCKWAVLIGIWNLPMAPQKLSWLRW